MHKPPFVGLLFIFHWKRGDHSNILLSVSKTCTDQGSLFHRFLCRICSTGYLVSLAKDVRHHQIMPRAFNPCNLIAGKQRPCCFCAVAIHFWIFSCEKWPPLRVLRTCLMFSRWADFPQRITHRLLDVIPSI